jgi:hypothetical protein
MNHLALLYRYQGKYAQAEPLDPPTTVYSASTL